MLGKYLNQLTRSIEEKMKSFNQLKDLNPFIEEISQSKIVMLGESSHGTHEFYQWRSWISKELLTRYGFNAIVVEGDWPPCFELNQYIQDENDNRSIREVLSHFSRWPTWMWANSDVILLAEELRSYNLKIAEEKRVGFFGLDVYSLFESIQCVLDRLERVNPFLARRARIRYGCFDSYHQDDRAYTKSLLKFPEGCENEVAQVLQEALKLRLGDLNQIKNKSGILFDIQQNARVVANAESYYRTMIYGSEDSWNVRDRHMMETLNSLLRYFGEDSKVIVWAHNTHIGDYRATSMLKEGQINLGGLAREEWGSHRVELVGFGTYEGEVIASHSWDGPIERMKVPPARNDSFEAAFHEVAQKRKVSPFYVSLQNERGEGNPLSQVHGNRAIGVVYHPAFERFGNYVETSLSNRYDHFIFFDQTSALEPLIQDFIHEEIPETWPRGQ